MASSSTGSSSHYSPKVLFIELRGELIGIDFEQLLFKPKSNRLINHGPISGAAPIHFRMNMLTEFEGIVGMKHVTLDSKVYLLGGERLRRGSIPTMSYLFQHSDSYLGPSGRVFSLLSNGITFRLGQQNTIPRLAHPNGNPIVAQIEGQIYVLQGKPYFDIPDPPSATFEVYHPSDKCWRKLPCPPPYRDNGNGDIFGHFLLGHKLFIMAEARQIYFFDTHTRKWEEGGEVFPSFDHIDLLPPTNGICVPFFPQLNYDKFQLMLSWDGVKEEVYALVMNSSTGRLLCYQPLKEISSGLHPVTETGQPIPLSKQSHFFFMLPDNQICAIWAVSDQHERLRLLISIFALKLCLNPIDVGSSLSSSPPRKGRFVEVCFVHKHDWTVTKEEAFPNYVNDAFLF